MSTRVRIIVSVIVFGAVAAGVGGAIAGGALRLPMRSDGRIETILVATDDVFRGGGAPVYPIWPPEPLYPRAERTVRADIGEAMPAPMPVVMGPPADLPPPYEVWMDGEERPGPDDWRRNDWRDDGRREPVRVREQPPRREGPPVVYGPPPGYQAAPPPPGYYGPPRG